MTLSKTFNKYALALLLAVSASAATAQIDNSWAMSASGPIGSVLYNSSNRDDDGPRSASVQDQKSFDEIDKMLADPAVSDTALQKRISALFNDSFADAVVTCRDQQPAGTKVTLADIGHCTSAEDGKSQVRALRNALFCGLGAGATAFSLFGLFSLTQPKSGRQMGGR